MKNVLFIILMLFIGFANPEDLGLLKNQTESSVWVGYTLQSMKEVKSKSTYMLSTLVHGDLVHIKNENQNCQYFVRSRLGDIQVVPFKEKQFQVYNGGQVVKPKQCQ